MEMDAHLVASSQGRSGQARWRGDDDTNEGSSPSPPREERLATTPTQSSMCQLSAHAPHTLSASETPLSATQTRPPIQSHLTNSRPPDLGTSPLRAAASSVAVQPAHKAVQEGPIASTSSTRPPTPSACVQPATLLNELSAGDGESILVVVVEEEESDRLGTVGNLQRGPRCYGGSQGGDIHVWDLKTLGFRARLSGHDSAVLALQLVPERGWLVSSSVDGTVRVWHTPTLSPLYLIHPAHDNVGDVLSLAWVPTSLLEGGQTIRDPHKRATGRPYAGCQDTTIQWIDLPPSFHLDHGLGNDGPSSSSSVSSPPIHRVRNKFFDTISSTDRPASRTSMKRSASHSNSATSLVSLAREFESESSGTSLEHLFELQFEASNVAMYSHHGYVYCLALAKSNERNVLVSGSGDETIRVWIMTHSDLTISATLESSSDAVLTMAARESTLYAGHQGGVIRVWDLDTFTCVRHLHPHQHDILTISILGDCFYSGAADGTLQRWDKSLRPSEPWLAHRDIVLTSTASVAHGQHLISGGNDCLIKIWDVGDTASSSGEADAETPGGFQGRLFHALSRLVGYKTIADNEHREECRQGALYLKRLLRDLGAESCLLPGAVGKNPIVLATFHGNAPRTEASKKRKRVLCYGHYDVVAADGENWAHDPFEMTGKNGWLYGRGVSDNKGPMLAIAAAASDLRASQSLDVDLVMVIEGEEESGSAGFQNAIRKNRSAIGDIDVILVSNSYWIGEDIPCLTFGLRGVIHASVRIQSNQPDLHSGMQGGVVSEPLVDMVRLLASLTDSDGRVRIPDFLTDVREMSRSEGSMYDTIVERCSSKTPDALHENSHIPDPRQSLINRWRQPALSIHKIDVAGASQKTLIPSWASSSVSIRIVPDQSLLEIVQQLRTHLNKAFAQLRTRNTLSVEIDHVADWWLGDIESSYFRSLASCIEAEWGTKPLFIREGGSIPSLPFLEREFAANALHFPMGLSSDSAHLPNERIPMINLERGRTIISRWLEQLPLL